MSLIKPPERVTLRWLQNEFTSRAQTAELHVQCPMDGNIDAKIAVVAQMPGEREVSLGTPLIGSSGKFLWERVKGKKWKDHNINRNTVYITNVIKRQVRTPKSKSVRAAMPKAELDMWQDLLMWELSQLPNLEIVLILGDIALEALTGQLGITNWRGSIMEAHVGERKVLCVVANNPAFIMRDPRMEIVFKFDLGKLKRVLDGRYRPYEITEYINPTAGEALDWIDAMHSDRRERPVSIDIETSSMETGCIGLANDPHFGMCINFRDRSRNRYSISEEIRIRSAIQRLVSDDGVRLVAQSGGFDSYFLWYKDRIKIRRIWFDTLLGHHTLYPQLPHSLAFLTSQYTDHPYYKDEGKEWKEGGDIETHWRYNVKDLCITYRAHQAEYAALEREGLLDFFLNHVMRIQPHLVHMTVSGVPMDIALKEYLAEEMAGDLSKREKEIVTEAARLCEKDPEQFKLNIRSWQQMKKVMFTELKMVGRGVSTDAENRDRIMGNPRTPEDQRKWLQEVGEFKEDDKFLGTYVKSKVDPDNRGRTEYKQFGTQKAPGRLSSSQVMWGTGMNLQNQPERMYPAYHSGHPDYRLIYFDAEQAEARVVAMEAGIDEWKEQFERARIDKSYDCHRALASDMFEIPYDEVPEKDRLADGTVTVRFISKRCRHGLNYRMGPDRLATTTGLSISDATRNYYIYHARTPELKKWWGRVEREAVEKKALYNAMGRRLNILGPITPESLESIVAFKPQSLVGDWINRVIYMSEDDERWPKNHARILLNIHDALIAVAHKDYTTGCLSVLKEHMETPIMIQGEPLIIPAALKMTEKPTRWIVERDEDMKPTIEFYEHEDGLYRWSNLTSVEL